MSYTPNVRFVFPLLLLAVAERTESFDRAEAGKQPDGWTTAKTGTGAGTRWEVTRDEGAASDGQVLAQLSSSANNDRFCLAILESESFRDGEIAVKLKPISGRLDQSGGLVWRYRDPKNYYVVRANALEDNVVLYKVENGKRSPLAPKGTPANTYGAKRKVPAKTWNSLRVAFEGSTFTVTFNGETIYQVEDATFPDEGKVGLWTKSDSITYFDDFEVKPK